jgi:uncharacterized protein YxjI
MRQKFFSLADSFTIEDENEQDARLKEEGSPKRIDVKTP